MVITTKEQRKALFNVFNRGPIYPRLTPEEQEAGITAVPITYKQFRRSVQPTFGMDGAVVVPWHSMWLAVERDGYVHS